jgi:uroporphyrinogen decarboxylase
MEFGKELIRKTFQLERTERVPWVPFIGCHGANLIGVSAEEYLQSSKLMIQGLSNSIQLYEPDGIPVIFDLQVEAEILGCKLSWAKDNPPSVISHPLLESSNINHFSLPDEKCGRIPNIIETLKEIKNRYPDIALYGLITGPFTLSLHLLGTDIFLKMYEEADLVREIIDFSCRVTMRMADIYSEKGFDVIAVVDPMTSQIDPASFDNFLLQPMSSLFSQIRDRGTLSSFFVCGNAQHNIELMCKCKPDNISIDENIAIDLVRETALKNNVSFGGNLKLTSVLLLGNEEQNKKHAVETIDIGGRKGFVLSPGCDLPMSTPKENLIAVSEIVRDEYKQEIIRQIEKKEDKLELLDLSEHLSKHKIVIDVVTLDSGSCAPCKYMMEAVKSAVDTLDDDIYFQEHKIKEFAGLQMMASLGVKNLPTICINGQAVFVSNIPSQYELVKTIKRHLKN